MKTRQELIDQYHKSFTSENMIDFFIEAGMVQVKEEETIEGALDRIGYGQSLIEHLANAGLKIVKKD
jgi:hypothetical protein